MRCFGIDWLEMYVNESPSVDYSPDGFRARGWEVREREYGTKQMAQMFILLDTAGNDFIEIRRMPRGLDQPHKQTVYQIGDSYVRFSNAYCYDDNPMQLMEMFLVRNKYTIKKIYRIDLFIDFVRFDYGDRPDRVIRRIVNHTYAKVNQTKRHCAGEDTWTECKDNWISWGKSGSMVSTKFYYKTGELRESGFKKPWIVANWLRCGLIDNPISLTLHGQSVDVWRLEFSIKGNAKGWIWVDKKESEDGASHILPHNQALYADRRGILNAIANLVPYYFRFKIYEEGKRKSLCKEKLLFNFDSDSVELGYRLTNTSDTNRVRPQAVDEDLQALRYLDKAYGKLTSLKDMRDLQGIITRVADKILSKYNSQYSDDAFVKPF